MIRRFSHLKPKVKGTRRSLLLIGAFFLFVAGIVLRLFELQVVNHPELVAKAEGRGRMDQTLEPLRGNIYAQRIGEGGSELAPIAINREVARLFADPSLIKNPNSIAEALAPLIGKSAEEIIPALVKKNDSYEILADDLDESTVKKIKALDLSGIVVEYRFERFYPEREDFAHLTGFLGYDGDDRRGQYGAEGTYDEFLRGVSGSARGQRDVSGSLIATSDFDLNIPENGADVVLTIDRALQKKSCEVLRSGIEKYAARDGTIVIMDPVNGDILSICAMPSFDPNRYWETENISIFSNPALVPYEPGSVIKAITMAAAFDTHIMEPSSTYDDTGSIKVGGYTITNAGNKTFGHVTMEDILDLSINTGAVHVALQVGKDLFKQYIEAFGFGKKTDVGLDGEQAGNIGSLNEWRDVYLATASYGQGVSVTPLQLVRAFAVIANGGRLIQPRIIKEIRFQDGRIEKRTAADSYPEVISKETATILSGMLASVVEKGYSKSAAVPGYYVAGKSGTALIPRSDKPGYTGETIHSFVGFAPVDKPRLVVLIKLTNPEKGAFSSYTAVPMFRDLVQFALDYFGIPKER